MTDSDHWESNAPTCYTGWKQVTDDCPVCKGGPRCTEGEGLRQSLGRRVSLWVAKVARGA